LLLHTIELKAESIKPKSTIPSTLSSRDIGQAADSLVQTKQDSLKNDSNYLPRTSAALKSLVSYACKDSIVYHTSTKTSTLFGESDVNYEDLSIKSYQIAININKNTVHAIGVKDSTDKLTQTPVFKQGGSEYKVEEATFNYETKRGIMKEFKTNEGEGFIKGEKVKRDENNNFFINHSYYTTCSDDHPHFYIAAEKLKVIPGKKVITGPANLVIEGVRTPLFVPLGIFPLKRGQQSGIIIPSYGNAVGRGFFLAQGGYYLGLGDHYDLTLLGDIYTNTSWKLGGRFNYNFKYKYAGSFNANFAYNKQNNPEDPNYSQFKTFQVQWNHRVDAKARPGVTFGADVNIVGNQYLVYNAYSDQSFNNVLNSSVYFGKVFNKGKQSLNSSARASQNLQTRDISLTLPDLTFTVASFQPFKPKSKPTADHWYEKISMNYTGLFQQIINTKDSLLFKERSGTEWQKYTDTAFNNGLRHAVNIQNSFNLFKYYTLSMGMDYNESWTFKTRQKTWDESSRTIKSTFNSGFDRAYSFSFRAGLSTRWYGLKNFKKGKLAAIRHVMNPSADFSYAPDFSADRYGFYSKVQKDTSDNFEKYSRFEGTLFGGPGAGRQGNINFSLDNNLEVKWKKGKDTAQKITKVKIIESLRGSGSYNLLADSLNLSIINVSGRTTLFKFISIIGGAVFDPYQNIIVESGNFKSYRRINRFNFDNGIPAILTASNMGLSASLNQDLFKGKEEKSKLRKKEMETLGFIPMNMPWSLSFNYTIAYDYRSKLSKVNDGMTQTLSGSGNINPTKNWFINFNTGFDFRLNKISHISIDLRRDLHCWQFTFNWTPLSAYGTNYFLFNINVKSSVLQDLKIPKKKDWYDDRKI